MKSITLLAQYLEERNQFLRTISDVLERDQRVKAAWLFGSIGRGDDDALSDIDLWVVVDDDQIDSITAQPRLVTAQMGTPILFVEAPQNAPEGGAYLMTCYDAPAAPHIVDCYWQPRSLAYIPGQVRLLFDRVGLFHHDQPIQFPVRPVDQELVDRPIHFISFFWMMLMIAAKQTVRSPWDEKMGIMPYLVDAVRKAQQYLGQENILQCGDIPPHQLPGEKLRLLYQLADQMSEIMAAIAEQGQEVPAFIKPGAYRYLDLIDSIIEDQE